MEWSVVEYPAQLKTGGSADIERAIELVGSTTTGTTVVDNAATSCIQSMLGIRFVAPTYTETLASSTLSYSRHADYVWDTLAAIGLPALSCEYVSTAANRFNPTASWTSAQWGAAQQTITLGEIYQRTNAATYLTSQPITERLGFDWLSGRNVAGTTTPTGFTAIGQNSFDVRTTTAASNTSGGVTDYFQRTVTTSAKIILQFDDVTLIDGAGATNPGCVNCPRVLDVYIEYIEPWQGTGATFYGCDVANGRAVVVADGIFVQVCKNVGEASDTKPFECEWRGTSLGFTARIRRLAPNLYTLEHFISSVWTTVFYWQVNTDCPGDVVDSPGIVMSCYSAIVAGVSHTREVFTRQASITITEVTDWPEGEDYCSCDCLNAPDIFQVGPRCNGDPLDGFTDIEVTRTSGCNWEGTAGGWRAELSFDTSTGEWSSAIYRVSDGLLLIDAIPWEADPRDPAGFHPFSGTDTGYPDPDDTFLDELGCSPLGIQIS